MQSSLSSAKRVRVSPGQRRCSHAWQESSQKMESWLFRPPSITAFSQTGHIATLVFAGVFSFSRRHYSKLLRNLSSVLLILRGPKLAGIVRNSYQTTQIVGESSYCHSRICGSQFTTGTTKRKRWNGLSTP